MSRVTTTKDEALVGTTLDGKYWIGQKLGEGGMGAVYEALHTGIDRRLAVKVLHPAIVHKPVVLKRFRREARITGSLGHPNIVEVMDTGTTPEGTPYLVMELLEGQTLASVLRTDVRLSVRRALDIITPVLRALSAVHARGIVHRDLKPENVFLAKGIRGDGVGETVVKVLDFGISKSIDTKFEGPPLTETGTVVGTRHYMSPEQLRGIRVDHRTDLYACGVILYEMLTGKVPFDANNPSDLLVAILTEVPVSMRTLRPEFSEALEEVVNGAMARDREERFASAEELLQALEPFRDLDLDVEPDTTAKAPAMVPKASRLKRWSLIVGFVVAVTAAITVSVLLGVVADRRNTGDPPSGSKFARDASPVLAPVVEDLPASDASSPAEPDGMLSEVEAGLQVEPDSGPPASTPEIPAVRRPGKTPSRRIVTDIDERRPPGTTKAPVESGDESRSEPVRIVTDIDERLPGDRRQSSP